MNRRTPRLAAWLLALSAPLLGCGSESANLSARATDDPARLETARAEVEEAERQSHQAEAARFGNALKGVEQP